MSSLPSPEKWEALQLRLAQLGVTDQTLVEKFIMGSGKGGQKINKTSSCVYLKHLPTGFEVKCQESRSRELNRFLAKRLLCDHLERLLLGKPSQKDLKIVKLKKQKKRRRRRSDVVTEASTTPQGMEE